MNVLIALANFENAKPAHITKLNKLRDSLRSIGEKRNRVCHDPWSMGWKSRTHYRLQKTARAKLDYSYKEVTEAELNEIRDEIRSWSEKFLSLRMEILNVFWKVDVGE